MRSPEKDVEVQLSSDIYERRILQHQNSPNSPEYFHYLHWDQKIKMIFYA